MLDYYQARIVKYDNLETHLNKQVEDGWQVVAIQDAPSVGGNYPHEPGYLAYMVVMGRPCSLRPRDECG